MSWYQNGINYVCQQFGDSAECVVSTGLYFDFKDDQGLWYYNQGPYDTSTIVDSMIYGIITSIKMTTPSRPQIDDPLGKINAANGFPITHQEAQSLIQHDETSGDQWCYGGGSECNAYLPFLFEFKVTNAAGTTITTAKTGDTVRLYARIARFASDPCAHYDLTFYTDSVAKTGQISQLSGDTYASDATGGEWVYKTWLIPQTQPLGSFPHFGVVETNTDEDVEQAFSITCFDSCACNTQTQCVAPCNWCTTPAPAHCQTAACGTTETDCSLITDPDLCIMPTCFWYKDYIWETGEGATCHSLEEMLMDNWFLVAAGGAVLIYMLLK